MHKWLPPRLRTRHGEGRRRDGYRMAIRRSEDMSWFLTLISYREYVTEELDDSMHRIPWEKQAWIASMTTRLNGFCNFRTMRVKIEEDSSTCEARNLLTGDCCLNAMVLINS